MEHSTLSETRTHWIAPSGKDAATDTLEKRLWDAADQFRANSGLSAATFEKAELLIPSAPLLKNFGDATTLMAEQIHTLQRQTQDLRQTRDLLLPRLLSGQVELS